MCLSPKGRQFGPAKPSVDRHRCPNMCGEQSICFHFTGKDSFPINQSWLFSCSLKTLSDSCDAFNRYLLAMRLGALGQRASLLILSSISGPNGPELKWDGNMASCHILRHRLLPPGSSPAISRSLCSRGLIPLNWLEKTSRACLP